MWITRVIWHIPRRLAQLLIRLYQRTLSPDHSWLRAKYPHGYCKFTPSCSQYGYEAYGKYGFVRGSVKTAWRIVRCNPWSAGGVDLP
ncbi:MAG: membrane protein insertion efficiency factor YidD [Patescibacteria group bacterium]